MRLAAANAEGYGPTSAEAVVTTPQVGVLPGSPRAVTLGPMYTGSSLNLHFEEPVSEGGAETGQEGRMKSTTTSQAATTLIRPSWAYSVTSSPHASRVDSGS